jgi:hypothetical protein
VPVLVDPVVVLVVELPPTEVVCASANVLESANAAAIPIAANLMIFSFSSTSGKKLRR